MMLRKVFFWVHMSVGSVAGIVILIMSVTGVMLAYERRITSWVDREYRSTPPHPGAPRIPAGDLLARVCTDQQSVPSNVTLYSQPDLPVEGAFGRDRTVYFDAYTANALGVGSQGIRYLFQVGENWHRWLGVQPKSRSLGRAVTGACNLAFLVLVTTGLFLWWPKSWTWPRLKAAITWRWSQPTSRARDWNWHTVTGFWCAVPLLVIVLCGVVMSYPWANNLLYQMTGNAPPPAQGPAAPPQAVRPGAGTAAPNGNLVCGRWDAGEISRLWERAQQQVPDWRSIGLRLPANSGGEVAAFSIDRGDGGRPDKRAQLTLNWQTAEVIRWEPFSSYNLGRRLRAWVRFSHTGEAGGLAGQTIAALATGATAILVFTGMMMAWRRLFSRR